MLARWYLLLGQFSVTFEYRPGAQHANADGISSTVWAVSETGLLQFTSSDTQMARVTYSDRSCWISLLPRRK